MQNSSEDLPHFEPVNVPEPVASGSAWMSGNVATARLAIAIVGKTEAKLEAFVRELDAEDDGSNPLDALLHDLEGTADVFKVVREIVQAADARLIVTIARIAEKEDQQH